MRKLQDGHIYDASGSLYVRYTATEIVDGQPKRVQRSHKLCEKDGMHELRRTLIKGRDPRKPHSHRTYPSPALEQLRREFMLTINSQQMSRATLKQDMAVVNYWLSRFLPYCEEVLPLTGQPRKRRSTVRGYKQIWNQHLKEHFASATLQHYEPRAGKQFLRSLTATQGKNTIKHIKSLAGAIFKLAVDDEIIKTNPWREVSVPEDAVAPSSTAHYTLAEAEDMISALANRVDAQLILALSCFLGLRPGEIAALRWEDFDPEHIHIRRSVVRGIVGQPKTPESLAPLPLISQVRLPLELYRQQCENPGEGWLFPGRDGGPISELHNMINRVIRPAVEGKGLKWKGLYAGRRGAATLAVEATNGNYHVAQALLRHKSMTTTLNVYKKQITPEAFKAGMKLLEAASRKQ
jgi:integrase